MSCQITTHYALKEMSESLTSIVHRIVLTSQDVSRDLVNSSHLDQRMGVTLTRLGATGGLVNSTHRSTNCDKASLDVLRDLVNSTLRPKIASEAPLDYCETT